MNRKFYFFIGTTAELIKLFPVMREMEARGVDFKIITSGQTSINFNEVKNWISHTAPDIALAGKSNESSVLLFLAWAFKCLVTAPGILMKEFKDFNKNEILFIVHGDTVSSLIGAMAAKICRVRIAHIESGLRSFNLLEPFPEEISRYIVSKLADISFCPNTWSMKNLSDDKLKVNTYENTLSDSYLLARKFGRKSDVAPSGKYFILLTHRQEHVVFGKEDNKNLVSFILKNFDRQLTCAFVTHATTADFLNSVNFNFHFWKRRKVKFIPRLNYIEFMNLVSGAEFIVTDGGSNQEEAYYIGLPCLLLRHVTERIEGLGKNAILAKSSKRIIKDFLKNYNSFRRDKSNLKISPSKIICDTLLSV